MKFRDKTPEVGKPVRVRLLDEWMNAVLIDRGTTTHYYVWLDDSGTHWEVVDDDEWEAV